MLPDETPPADRHARSSWRGTNRWRWSAGAVLWLVFLLPVVADILASDRSVLARTLTLADGLVFIALYVAGVPLVLGRPHFDARVISLPVATLVTALLLLPVGGQEAMSSFVYVAVVAAALLPVWAVATSAFTLAVLGFVLGAVVPGWTMDEGGLAFSVGLATVGTLAFTRLIRRNIELDKAREDLALLAVEEERLRFARDLHDLLGHSLTVITVKSELAGRLIEHEPSRAAAEIADIERLAREALADVRTTVAGYRGVTLAAEVLAARSALSAAGVDAELPGALDDVPGERRELFGWVVREGVTNIVRHASADRAWVVVTPSSVEVRDDGAGCAGVDGAEGNGMSGHGLHGLRERVAEAGGRLEAGPVAGGGFRLFAEVPSTSGAAS